MPVRKMQRFTEQDVQRIVARGVRGTPPDVVAFIETTGLPCESDGSPAQAAGSRTDAAMDGAESWVVMPYPVGGNRAWRQANGKVIPNPKAVAWKRQAAESARLAGIQIITGPVEIHCRLHPRLNKDGTPSKTRLDCDAPLKLLLDALNGVAYRDDSQIVKIVAEIAHPVAGGALSVRVGQKNIAL